MTGIDIGLAMIFYISAGVFLLALCDSVDEIQNKPKVNDNIWKVMWFVATWPIILSIGILYGFYLFIKGQMTKKR